MPALLRGRDRRLGFLDLLDDRAPELALDKLHAGRLGSASGGSRVVGPFLVVRSGSGRRDALPTAQARPSRREKSLPDAPPPAADDEEWPDDAGPAAGGAEPTGMELIERQLGGTVIEEIEEP